MRKLSWIPLIGGLAVLILVLVLAAGCGGSTTTTTAATTGDTTATTVATETTAVTAASDDPYKIGMIIEESGPISALSVDVRDAANLEVDAINAKGGVNGHPLEMIVIDNGTDASKNTTGMTKLIKQDKVLAVIGPLWGVLVPQSQAIAEREGTVDLITSMPDNVTRLKNYKSPFTLAQPENVIQEAMLTIAVEKGYKKVVAISDVQGSWIAMAQEMAANGPAMGVQVTAMKDTFTPGDVDMSAQATKMKAIIDKEGSDAIALCTNGIDALTFLKAIHKLGVNLPVIGTHAMGLLPMLEIGAAEVEGMSFPSGKVLLPDALPDSDPQKAILVDFTGRYQAKFNKPASQFAAHGYDAVHMLADALAAVGPDKAKIRDFIENLKAWPGATAIYTYGPTNHEGMGLESLAEYTVKDGKFVFVEVMGSK